MKILSALFFVAASTSSHLALADSNELQSALNEVCKASLISENAARRTARELGVTKAQRDRLLCNNEPMTLFAKNYGAETDLQDSGNATKIVNIQ